MSYIILNGVRSDSIRGLLISSLPSISKPMLRTEVEEIDGRDGDIVTPLGYSAYNKEMSIGLYGQYDIDEVIEYFDSEGEVIFSNEPDKVYRYKIIEQIDFEKLIRYKTATVTFHVQPHKYSAVETAYSFENTSLSIPDYTVTKYGVTVTASNGVISISGTSTRSAEFYIPVEITLEDGASALEATVIGTGAVGTLVRVIQQSPVNDDSVAQKVLHITADNSIKRVTGGNQAGATYHYLWILIPTGKTVNFTMNVNVMAVSCLVYNIGNTVSRPKLTIYGTGTLALSINGTHVLTVVIPDDYITIDGEAMEATVGDVLANRYVAGDYDDIRLKKGRNVISWTGTVSRIVIENYSRWI